MSADYLINKSDYDLQLRIIDPGLIRFGSWDIDFNAKMAIRRGGYTSLSALLMKVKADVSVHHAHVPVRISEAPDANSAAVSNSISDGMADATT